MEQVREGQEATSSGTGMHAGFWPADRFPAANEQRSTRSCSRCDGLLVNEWCHDLLDDTGGLSIEVLRCVQCGHRVDPVILRNRISPPVLEHPSRRPRLGKSAGIPVSCEAG